MRTLKLIPAAISAAALLASCGDTSVVQDIADGSGKGNTHAARSSADSPTLPTEIPSSEGKAEVTEENVDIDLTELSASMVYGQVYDMMYNSDDYVGKIVKMEGAFSYYLEPSNGQEYFAVIISDATACCSQGIEFVLDGDYKYPDDYPELNEEITVIGRFNYYKEGVYTYCQLTDAKITDQ